MTTDELLAVAADKVRSTGAPGLATVADPAASLLADLYAAGLRHGITPEEWSAVASLARDCVDVLRARDRARELARERASVGFAPRETRGPRRDLGGR